MGEVAAEGEEEDLDEVYWILRLVASYALEFVKGRYLVLWAATLGFVHFQRLDVEEFTVYLGV